MLLRVVLMVYVCVICCSVWLDCIAGVYVGGILLLVCCVVWLDCALVFAMAGILLL